MLHLTLEYGLYAILSIMACILVGYFPTRYLTKSSLSFTQIAIAFFLGVTLITTLFATVLLSGQSILTFSLPTLLLLLWLLKKRPMQVPAASLRTIALLSLLAILLPIVIYSLQAFQPGEVPIRQPHPDYMFYTYRINGMLHAKVESAYSLAALVSDSSYYPDPFHYFELHLAGLLSIVFGIPTTMALVVVLPIVLHFGIFITVLAIGEHSRRTGYLFWLLFGVFAPLPIPFWVSSIFSDASVFMAYGSILNFGIGIKLLHLYFIALFGALLYLKLGIRAFLLVLSYIVFTSITTLALLPAVVGTVLYLVIIKKDTFKAYIPIGVSLLFFVLGYLTLYSGGGGVSGGAAAGALPIQQVINIAGKSLVSLLLLYLPILLVILPYWRKLLSTPLAYLYGTVVVFGLLGWMLSVNANPTDATQLFAIPATLLIPVLWILFNAKVPTLSAKIVTALFGAYGLIVFYNNAARDRPAKVSGAYYEALATLQPNSKIGAFFSNTRLVDQDIMFTKKTFSGVRAWPLFVQSRDYLGTIPMNDPIVGFDESSPYERHILEQYPFYRFYGQRKGTEEQLANLQAAYLQKHNIDWIVLEKGAELPDTITKWVTKTIFDKQSGEKIVILALP